jgi:hypothetical protein
MRCSGVRLSPQRSHFPPSLSWPRIRNTNPPGQSLARGDLCCWFSARELMPRRVTGTVRRVQPRSLQGPCPPYLPPDASFPMLALEVVPSRIFAVRGKCGNLTRHAESARLAIRHLVSHPGPNIMAITLGA